jgi:uncharacterized protein (TIGR03083 family)
MPNDATAEADRWIHALRLEQDQLASQVRALSADQLAGPSACSDWSIAQVLSHLGAGAELMGATVAAAVRGQDDPRPDAAPAVFDRWDAMTPAEQGAGYLEWSERLVATLEALDDDDRARARIDLGFLPEPADVATIAALRLNELTLHAWDVRVMADPAAALTPTSVDVLLDRSGVLIGFIGHPEVVESRPVTVAVETFEPSRSMGLDLAEKTTLTAAAADPKATVTLPAEAFLRLVAGRLDPEHTPASVGVTGDAVTLDDLRKVFPGY